MISPNQRSYFYSLGKFVHAYSKVEITIHLSFHRFAKIDASTAAAIKRSMKMNDAISIIKNLLVLNKFSDEDQKELAYTFEQLAHISTFRDSVLHRGADEQPNGTFFSSNMATAKSLASLESAVFSAQDIKNATNDLKRIVLRITSVSAKIPKHVFAKIDGVELLAPWRYKPVKLENTNQRRQAANQAGARQPPSSPKKL